MAAAPAMAAARRGERGLRRLGLFWLVILLAAGAGAGVLAYLGPPAPAARGVRARPPGPPAPAPVHAAGPAAPVALFQGGIASPNRPGAPIPAALPKLIAPAPYVGAFLPRVARDGLTPMAAYSAGFDRADPRPRIGIVISDIGLAQAESETAIRVLPAAVALAFSPYAGSVQALQDEARRAGHELLVSIPMEPRGAPLSSAGPRALASGLGPAQNAERLAFALSRITAYAGTTGGLGAMLGERFSADQVGFDAMLRTIARRGLYYLDARPGAPHPPFAWGTSVSVILDRHGAPGAFDRHLAALETIARRQGWALGYLGAPAPRYVRKLAAWTATLDAAGFVLAPPSALITAPPASRP